MVRGGGLPAVFRHQDGDLCLRAMVSFMANGHFFRVSLIVLAILYRAHITRMPLSLTDCFTRWKPSFHSCPHWLQSQIPPSSIEQLHRGDSAKVQPQAAEVSQSSPQGPAALHQRGHTGSHARQERHLLGLSRRGADFSTRLERRGGHMASLLAEMNICLPLPPV